MHFINFILLIIILYLEWVSNYLTWNNFYLLCDVVDSWDDMKSDHEDSWKGQHGNKMHKNSIFYIDPFMNNFKELKVSNFIVWFKPNCERFLSICATLEILFFVVFSLYHIIWISNVEAMFMEKLYIDNIFQFQKQLLHSYSHLVSHFPKN